MEVQGSASSSRLREPCGARIVENGARVNRPDLSERVRRDIAGEGGCTPERRVIVEVEEARFHHVRRVPLPEKPNAELRGKESS